MQIQKCVRRAWQYSMNTSPVITVHDVDSNLSNIIATLYEYQTYGVEHLSNGSTFICPLEIGSFSYLHKLFLGCGPREIVSLGRSVGFPLSIGYSTFLKIGRASCRERV